MRKVVLIFGALYTLIGVTSLQMVSRLTDLYSKFDANLPLSTYLSFAFYILLPLFGIGQILIYFKRVEDEKVYKALLITDVLIFLFGFALAVSALIMPIYNLTSSL